MSTLPRRPRLDIVPAAPSSDSLADRGMPASPEAEKSILGAILLDSGHILETIDGLNETDFSLESHRRIYRRMLDLHKSGSAIDLMTLMEELSRRKELDSIGGASYLASLTEGLPRRLSVVDYVKIVADKSVTRAVVQLCYEFQERAIGGRDHGADLIRDAIEGLLDVGAKAKTLLHTAPKREVFVGAVDFILNAPKEVQWMVDGIVQADGNGVIVGDPKASKSLASLDMMIHMVAGRPWLGKSIPQHVKCALISREDSPGLTQRRAGNLIEAASPELQEGLREININDCLYFNSRAQTNTFSLQKDSDMQEIIQALRSRGVQYALFDVFRSLWDGDENDNREVAQVVARLTQIQTEAKCSVALIHHIAKSGDGTIFQRMRGASALYGWAEWGIGITTVNPDAAKHDLVRKVVFQTKASEGSDALHYRIENPPNGMRLVSCEAPMPAKKKKALGYPDQASWNDRG